MRSPHNQKQRGVIRDKVALLGGGGLLQYTFPSWLKQCYNTIHMGWGILIQYNRPLRLSVSADKQNNKIKRVTGQIIGTTVSYPPPPRWRRFCLQPYHFQQIDVFFHAIKLQWLFLSLLSHNIYMNFEWYFVPFHIHDNHCDCYECY